MEKIRTRIAVVILNWNGKSFLERFLPNLIQCSSTVKDAKIIVADNASTDDSCEFMRRHYPDIPLLIHDENTGFATGYNLAFRHIDAEYFVLLNSDIEVTPFWIEPIIAQMDADLRIAVVQPKLKSFQNRELFEYAGSAGGFIDYLGYPFCRGRIFEQLEKDEGQYETETEIFWATGAAFFVRASLYMENGGLDDDFFAHMEEIDFCWRMKRLGYKIMYQPKSVVYHIGGGTLPKSSPFKTYLNFRNNLFLLYKNLGRNQFRKIFWKRWSLDVLAALRFLVSSPKEFSAVCRAYRDFFKGRKRYVPDADTRSVPHIYQKSIVLSRFLLGKKFFKDLEEEKFSR